MEITSYALQSKAIRKNIASNKRALQLKANPKPSCLRSFKKENYEFGTSYNHVASQYGDVRAGGSSASPKVLPEFV